MASGLRSTLNSVGLISPSWPDQIRSCFRSMSRTEASLYGATSILISSAVVGISSADMWLSSWSTKCRVMVSIFFGSMFRLQELAVQRLIRDEAKHFAVANVRFHDVLRVCCIGNGLYGAKSNRRRAEICDKNLERFFTAYVSNPCTTTHIWVVKSLGSGSTRIGPSSLVTN